MKTNQWNGLLNISKVERRGFYWWLSLILFAGGVPNLLADIPNFGDLLLLGAVSGSVWVLVAQYVKRRRRRGVAAVVHFPTQVGDQDYEMVPRSIQTVMERDHHAWFRVGPEPEEMRNFPTKRVNWALQCIRFRVEDAGAQVGQLNDVCLYLKCRLPEAFSLGTIIRQSMPSVRHDSKEEALSLAVGINLQVAQISDYDDTKSIFRVSVSDILRSPYVSIHRDFLRVDVPRSGAPSRTPRIGLAVFATKKEEGASLDKAQKFFREAVSAAEGANPGGYAIHEGDICDSVMTIEVDWEYLDESLRSANAAPTIAAIRNSWMRVSQELYQSTEIPVRLFLLGPAILAFILGSILPRGSRLVAYGAPIPEDQSVIQSLPETEKYYAVLDGDDVGAVIEHLMLADDASGVVNNSKRIANDFSQLVCHLQGIEGVKHLSTGGDSLLFEVDPKAINQFSDTLNSLRKQISTPYSCGIAQSIRDAFIALREAKTSGKGVTIARWPFPAPHSVK